MNKRKTLAIVMSLMLVAVPVMVTTPVPASAAPIAPAPPPPSGGLTTAIMQTITGVGTFTGSLTVNSVSLINGVLNAVGTITGTLTDTAGNVVGSITNAPITIPLTGFTGTCTILTLHTGMINLSLLGLNVTLSPIDLVITAIAAPGNLLGNLLCDVANLLNSGGPLSTLLTGLQTLLNNILGAIRV
jgi:hypothetical protein